MRAITVRQPWAWAIVHGGKDIENRTRNIAGAYRGPVAIHAAQAEADNAPDDLWMRHATYYAPRVPPASPVNSVRGAVIGVIDLWHVNEPHERCDWCSVWAMDGHWQLCLRDPRPLATPIPWRGALGLWTVPDELEASIREQVPA